jgi:hypothetical protein
MQRKVIMDYNLKTEKLFTKIYAKFDAKKYGSHSVDINIPLASYTD